MINPKNIINLICYYFFKIKKLKNLKIMITTGPTNEALDPMYFISNHNSKKMSFFIAYTTAIHEAHVTLISRLVNLKTPLL